MCLEWLVFMENAKFSDTFLLELEIVLHFLTLHILRSRLYIYIYIGQGANYISTQLKFKERT